MPKPYLGYFSPLSQDEEARRASARMPEGHVYAQV